MFWKIIKRTLVTIIILFLTLIVLYAGLFVYSAFFGLKSTDTDIARYDEYRNSMFYSEEFMPLLDELGNYQDIAFGQTEVYYNPFFISHSMNLFVQYGEEEYLTVKSTALEGMTCITEADFDYGGELVMLPNLEHRGYKLQAIQLLDDYWACKYVGFIGFDDEHHAICYLLYNDPDRDYIAEVDEDPLEAMRKWLNKEFWWHTFD